MSISKFIKELDELKNLFEEIIPCIEAYRKENLTYKQKLGLIPLVIKKLEKKYGVDKIIDEVKYAIHDVLNTFHKMHQDFDNKKYMHCAIDFAKGIFKLIPGLKETLPEMVSLGVEATEETNKIIATNGAILAAQSAEVAMIFIENTISATCQIIEENPYSTTPPNANQNNTNTTHDEL